MPSNKTRRPFLSILLALCLAASALPGAEESALLPGRLTLLLSAKSLSDLTAALDGFVPAVTRKMPSAVSRGTIPAMVAMLLPLPYDVWLASEEVQALFTSTLLDSESDVAFLIRARSFSDFLDGLRDAGAEIEEKEGGRAYLITDPLERVFIRDLGEGRIALAGYNGEDDPDRALERIFRLDSGGPVFPPRHNADCLVSVTISPERLRLKEYLLQEIEKSYPGAEFHSGQTDKANPGDILISALSRDLREKGLFREEILKPLLAAAGEKLSAAFAELTNAKSLRLDISFDNRDLRLVVGLEPAEGGFLGKIAARLAKLGQVEQPLASRVGDDALSILAAAPLPETAPDLLDAFFLVPLAGEILAPAFPAFRERIAQCSRALSGLFAGGWVNASYGFPDEEPDKRILELSLIRTDNPDAALQTLEEAVNLANDLLDQALAPSRSGLRLRMEKPAGPTGPNLEIGIDPEGARHELESLLGGLRILFGKDGGALLSVRADGDPPDAYAKALKLISGDKGASSLISLPPARRALGMLGHAQGLVWLSRSDQVMRMFLRLLYRLNDWAEDFSLDGRLNVDDDEMPVLGLGADSLGPVLEIRLPVSAIAAVLPFLRRADGRYDVSPWGDMGDDNYDDGDDDDDGAGDDDDYDYEDEEEEDAG